MSPWTARWFNGWRDVLRPTRRVVLGYFRLIHHICSSTARTASWSQLVSMGNARPVHGLPMIAVEPKGELHCEVFWGSGCNVSPWKVSKQGNCANSAQGIGCV